MEFLKLQQMMACVAVSPSLVKSLHRWVDLFSQEDNLKCVYLWYNLLADYYQQWDQLPSVTQIQAVANDYVAKYISQMEPTMTQYNMAMLGQTMQVLVGITDNRQAERLGQELVAEFLRERISHDYARRFAQPNCPIAKLSQAMARDLAAVDGTVATQFGELFPGGEFPTTGNLQLLPTGINFIDVLLGGGLLNGEAVGHLAAIGQGKTTLNHQVCYSIASNVVRPRLVEAGREGRAADLSGLPYVYMFAYERVVNLLPNIISNAASIPRDIAANAFYGASSNGNAVLRSSADKNWGDYELKAYAAQFAECEAQRQSGVPDDQIKWPSGERERFLHATNVINNVWRVVDFSGHDRSLLEYASAGVAGMGEYIEAHQHKIGNPGVSFVSVDYVGVAALRAGSKSRLGNTDGFKRDFVQAYPDLVSREIAAKYGCPVWLSHQLNPNENKKPPGSVPDPMNAEASGMFLELCAAGFASGRLTADNVAAFKVGKSRRKSVGDIELQLGCLSKTYARWTQAKGYEMYEGNVEREGRGGGPDTRGGIPPGGGFSSD